MYTSLIKLNALPAKIYETCFRYHGEAPTLGIPQASLEAALAKTELSNSIDFDAVYATEWLIIQGRRG